MSQPTVLWEITRSCTPSCDYDQTDDLSTYEAYKAIDQIVALKARELIITGGDPLLRNDIDQLVDYARRRGLEPAIALCATPTLTTQWLAKLHDAGAKRLIFAINGSTAGYHDVEPTRGSFAMTLEAIQQTLAAGLLVEIDTLVTRRNAADMAAIADLLETLGVGTWTVHFIVPLSDARKVEILSAAEAERVFELLAEVQRAKRLRVRTIEAPEYRRYLLQKWDDESSVDDVSVNALTNIAESAIDDVVFIGANGSVHPSEFLPLVAGNIRYRPLFGIVRGSDLFVAIRDRRNLTGKCARCDFNEVCGGSRARAWAMTGYLFGPDPLCVYDPPRRAATTTTL